MKTLISSLALGLALTSTAFADQATLEMNLKQQYPELPAKVTGSTPINGLYEVQISSDIVYTDEHAQYFLVGNLIDFKNKENLTSKREQQLNSIDVSSLPLNQAIKQVKGNGSRVLYVFSDPDCPYCQQLEKTLASINNITIYTFLMPLVNLHPNAEIVSKQIWCSSNKVKALADHMQHQEKLTSKTTCANPIEKNIKLGQSLNINGTPTLFLQNGRRIAGSLDAEQLEYVLK